MSSGTSCFYFHTSMLLTSSEISSLPGVLLVLFNHPAPNTAQRPWVNHKNYTVGFGGDEGAQNSVTR